MRIIQQRVTSLRILPDEDPNIDRNMQKSLNKTNVTQWHWIGLIFDKFVMLT
jgi:hypothetical protein